MGKVFAYARVSTPRQGEKGVSLQEQKSAIERYARQRGLEVVRWFEERESAAKTGRRQFTSMLRLLRLKVADGVIIHKIDRSARNLEDWADLGKVVDAGADIHFATENLDLKTVSGRLSADIQAVVAAHYSRNLREEAKKGFFGRLKQGLYPLRAPIGYLDQGSGHAKTPDTTRAPLIRNAFDLYSTGKFSLPHLATEMFRRGLRNRTGGPVSVNGLATILKNPFYIGLMHISTTEQTFSGAHEPLIAIEVFKKVQDVLAGKRVDRVQNHIFTYSRLARCATCGYSLIAERQKGHTYYRCHNRPFKTPVACPPTSIREERLDEIVLRNLTGIDLTDNELQVAHALLQERRKTQEQDRALTEQTLRLQYDHVQRRLSKLVDLLIEGTLTQSLYEAKHKALLMEQASVKSRLHELEHGIDLTIRKLEETVELAKSPSLLYKMASTEQKRELLKTLLSNLTVSSNNVEIMLSLPFQWIAERRNSTECRANRGTCRTWTYILHHLYRYFDKHKPKLLDAA